MIIGAVAIGAGAYIITRPQAEFEVSNLMVENQPIWTEENFTVLATVKNVGGAKGSYEETLKLDNSPVKSKEVNLGPGESQKIRFTLSVNENGKFTVGVNGSSRNFRAYKPILFEGAFLKYRVKAFAPFLGNISGKMSIKFTEVSEESYTITMQPSGDLSTFMKPKTETKDMGESGYVPGAVEGRLIGTETLDTEFGTMELAHYRLENRVETGIENTDSWIEEETNVPVKIYSESPGGATVDISILQTNINYLKSKAES